MTAGSMTLFGVFSGPELAYVYPNGDAVSNVDVVYLCRDYTGHTHRQQGEVNRLRWFAPQGRCRRWLVDHAAQPARAAPIPGKCERERADLKNARPKGADKHEP